jgi:hypothetical protein
MLVNNCVHWPVDWRSCRLTASCRSLVQQGANLRPHGEEFVQIRGFGEEKCRVVRAAVFTGFKVLRRAQHQNRSTGEVGLFPDCLQNPIPGDFRQIQIEENAIRRIGERVGAAEDRNAIGPIVRQKDFTIEALPAKSFSQQENIAIIVVDYDDPGLLFLQTFTHWVQDAKLPG